MRRFLKEPLLHFVAIGGVLFVLYGLVSPEKIERRGEIVVDRQRVAALVSEHERTWQRPPTADELEHMIDVWVREEVFYREGLGAGFDADDAVVRRRVVQKMTFLAEGMAADVPSDAAVEAWFKAHAEDYRIEPTYTLRQVFFESGGKDPDAETALIRAQSALEADARVEVGDRTQLPSELRDASTGDVTRVFGEEFASALPTLKDAQWSKVRSGFGLHLVRIEARNPARLPKLVEVRKVVERDLAQARTKESVESFYRSARARYEIRREAGSTNLGAAQDGGKGAPTDAR